MPYNNEWEPNELFLEHNGVRIFHTYKYDEGEVRTYWFGTANDTTDQDDDTNFDVRDMPTWVQPQHPPFINAVDKATEDLLKKAWEKYQEDNMEENAIRAAIIAAIDAGHLKQYIEAARERPKEIPSDFPNEPKTVDLNGFSSIDLEALLVNIHYSVLNQTRELYRKITGGSMQLLQLGKDAVEHSDGGDYTITGILMHGYGTKVNALMILQIEDGVETAIEQYMEEMKTHIVLLVLKALQNIQESL